MEEGVASSRVHDMIGSRTGALRLMRKAQMNGAPWDPRPACLRVRGLQSLSLFAKNEVPLSPVWCLVTVLGRLGSRREKESKKETKKV